MNELESTEVTCPSELIGSIRPLTVQDIALLNKRENDSKKKGKKKTVKDPMGRMISGVWLETLDSGIYGAGSIAGFERGKPLGNLGNTLLGDRAFITYAVRNLTHGPDLHFKTRCPIRTCREPIVEHVNLDDIEISGLSEEAQEGIKKDGLEAVFYRQLPKANIKVGFRLMKGSDQTQLAAAAKQGPDIFAINGLLLRLPRIEGIDSPGERRKFVQTMHIADAEFLKEEWEKADIFVQDTIETECLECGWFGEIPIPVDAHFFSAKSGRPLKT
jgi:hypothetical protein